MELRDERRPIRTPPPPYSAETPLYNNISVSRTNQVVTAPPRPRAQHTPQQRRTLRLSERVSFFLSILCCASCLCCGQVGMCCIVPAIVYAVQAHEADKRGAIDDAAKKNSYSIILSIIGCIVGLLFFVGSGFYDLVMIMNS